MQKDKAITDRKVTWRKVENQQQNIMFEGKCRTAAPKNSGSKGQAC